MSQSIGPRRRGAATPEVARPLTSAGEYAPSEALGVVLKELRGTKLTDQSTSRMAELLVRFTIFLEKGHRLQRAGSISQEHVRGFVFDVATGNFFLKHAAELHFE